MEQAIRRSIPARIGIVALNLLAPGLGMMRLGRARAGLAWMLLGTVLLAVLIAYYALTPTIDFIAYAIIMAGLIAFLLAAFGVSMVQSWRSSAWKGEPAPWWTRWYALVGLWLLADLFGQGGATLGHRYYKPFYAPGESMTPAIALNDRFLVDMRPTMAFRRGEVIVFAAAGVNRIDRIAGLPGDRVAMRHGIPVINGQPVFQRPLGDFRYDGMDGPTVARRFEERFPGEAGSHFVLDFGDVPEIDETPELWVPPGHLFVLGDNRDRAADSRAPRYRNGVGLPSFDDVRGRPLFFYWSGDRSRIGRRIGQ